MYALLSGTRGAKNGKNDTPLIDIIHVNMYTNDVKEIMHTQFSAGSNNTLSSRVPYRQHPYYIQVM
jgi:hypothetical protein